MKTQTKKKIPLSKKSIDLLKHLYENKGIRLNVKEYSRKKNIHRSTVYSILYILEKENFIQKQKGNHKISKEGELAIRNRKVFTKRKKTKPIKYKADSKGRDNFCYFCDIDYALNFHHIVRRCDGGLDEANNILVVCCNCHWLLHHADHYLGFANGRYFILKRPHEMVKKPSVRQIERTRKLPLKSIKASKKFDIFKDFTFFKSFYYKEKAHWNKKVDKGVAN